MLDAIKKLFAAAAPRSSNQGREHAAKLGTGRVARYVVRKSGALWTATAFDARGRVVNGINGDDLVSVLTAAKRHWPGAQKVDRMPGSRGYDRSEVLPKMVRGESAIRAAEAGAPLFVFNPQRGWVPAGPGALARARKMPPHALWIYGTPSRADRGEVLPFRRRPRAGVAPKRALHKPAEVVPITAGRLARITAGSRARLASLASVASLPSSRVHVPSARLYVLAEDRFMSGWGPATARTNIVVFPVASSEEADWVERKLRNRPEMKRIRVVARKPKQKPNQVFSIMSPETSRFYYPGPGDLPAHLRTRKG